MKEELPIPTFKELDDYYVAANTSLRSKHQEFNVLRFCDLEEELVPTMGPFKFSYFQVEMAGRYDSGMVGCL